MSIGCNPIPETACITVVSKKLAEEVALCMFHLPPCPGKKKKNSVCISLQRTAMWAKVLVSERSGRVRGAERTLWAHSWGMWVWTPAKGICDPYVPLSERRQNAVRRLGPCQDKVAVRTELYATEFILLAALACFHIFPSVSGYFPRARILNSKQWVRENTKVQHFDIGEKEKKDTLNQNSWHSLSGTVESIFENTQDSQY